MNLISCYSEQLTTILHYQIITVQQDCFILKNTIMNLLLAYGLLSIAIIAEVIGTAFLVKSHGFTKLMPTTMTIICYILSFYLLAQVTKTLPIGIAYAIWGGVGVALTALIGLIAFKQTLDLPAIIGILLIVSGVVVMNVFSNSVTH